MPSARSTAAPPPQPPKRCPIPPHLTPPSTPSPCAAQVDSVDDSQDIEWDDDKPSKPSDSRRLLRMR